MTPPKKEVVVTVATVTITMPLFRVGDRDPALPSRGPLELVLSPGLSLSSTQASGLVQGHPWWGGDDPRKEGVGLPRAQPARRVSGRHDNVFRVPCESQGWAPWPRVRLVSSKPPRVGPSWGRSGRDVLTKPSSFPVEARHGPGAGHSITAGHATLTACVRARSLLSAGAPCRHRLGGGSALRIRHCVHSGTC